MVKRVLVPLHVVHFSLEAGAPRLLVYLKDVVALSIARSVGLAPLGGVVDLWVDPEVIVKCSLVPRWLLHRNEAA